MTAQADGGNGPVPTFREALRFWVKLGFISFGGPGGQIAIMHEELVERRRWIGHERFLHALNFCMLLPGPEAQQLAVYCGWLLHGLRGALAGGICFVLPSAVLLWALSWLYVSFGQTPALAAVFHGLKPAVLGIVLVALFRIGRKTLTDRWLVAISAGSFAAIFFLSVPFPAIIGGAALAGYLLGKGKPAVAAVEVGPAGRRIAPGRLLVTMLALWAAPVAASALVLGLGHAVTQAGLFFSKAALLTFGGAYAVLPYVAQQAVEARGWLSAEQMMDGLGLAETTPGPLVIVLEYVGFLGGWNHPGALPRLWSATLAAAMTVWVTFVPCFLWVLLGAPHMEKLRARPGLQAALQGITAGVVGVILNLAVWFGAHVLVRDGGADWFAVAITLVVAAGLAFWRWNVVGVVLGSAAAGWAAALLNIV